MCWRSHSLETTTLPDRKSLNTEEAAEYMGKLAVSSHIILLITSGYSQFSSCLLRSDIVLSAETLVSQISAFYIYILEISERNISAHLHQHYPESDPSVTGFLDCLSTHVRHKSLGIPWIPEALRSGCLLGC